MILVKPYFEIITKIDSNIMLTNIEKAGRTCYKSESNITVDSAKTFITKILKSGHETVIEHESISVRIICDRGVSHEIVRHRIASYSQESTIYCDYTKKQLTFIIPPWVDIKPGVYLFNDFVPTHNQDDLTWYIHMLNCEAKYKALRKNGWLPKQARSILPNSLKTELVMTMNLREWRHFFRLRTSKRAHPQMRELTIPLLNAFKEKLPVIFNNLVLNYD